MKPYRDHRICRYVPGTSQSERGRLLNTTAFAKILRSFGKGRRWIGLHEPSLSKDANCRLRRQQIQGAIDQIRTFTLGNTFFAPILSAQAWNQGQNYIVIAWTVLMLLFSWSLLFLWRASYHNEGKLEDMRRFVTQTCINAGIWSTGMILFYDAVHGDNKTVFAAIMVGSLALGTVGFSAAPFAAICYLAIHVVVLATVPLLYAIEYSSGHDLLLSLMSVVISIAILKGVLERAKAQLGAFMNVEVLKQQTIELQQASVELAFKSRHDGLTGLLNRSSFDEALSALLESTIPNHRAAVIIADLNDFKPINDSLGHAAGDAVLKFTAMAIRSATGESGVIARLGGDEFIVAVSGADADELKLLCASIAENMSKGIAFKDTRLSISASFGIAISDAELNTVAKVCAAADQAMYRSKSDPAKLPVLYEKNRFPRRTRIADRRELEMALKEGHIVPYFQPKVHAQTGELCGFEALARWQHPQKGLLLPGEFLQKLVELNLMLEFTLQITRYVLKNISLWVKLGLAPGRVAINIPEEILATQSGFEELKWLIDEYSDCAQFLTFEITEDVVLARSGDKIREAIKYFRDMDINISLDDFGTGYASFQHLREIDLDELKIDRSFVANLSGDRSTRVLVDGFMTICRGLRIEVVAEGVETQEQLQKVRELGCKYAQGYLFGKAKPASEALAQLEAMEITKTKAG